MKRNLGTLENVLKIENRISDGIYDYLLNWNDDEYSIINIVDNIYKIDWDIKGWYLWIVKNPDKDDLCNGIGVQFIQTATGKWGTDHHVLSDDEINNLVIFFLGDNYKMNKIKNKIELELF